ncbi:MAG: ligase-associated DNA damage response endonuclease PdeM [Pseudomonadota bacterium]
MSTTDTLPAGSVAVCVRGERLVLLGDRAAWLPGRQTLLVADWHLGKADVFGRFGLPIPAGDEDHDLARLGALLATTRSRRLLILGDLMHAPPTAQDAWPAALRTWLDGYPDLDVTVVAGNHDRMAAVSLPAGLAERLTWLTEPLDEDGWRFDHEPAAAAGQFVVAGHLHPTRRLVLGADRMRAPAFWLQPKQLVLPAFGSFTGGYNIRPAPTDRVFVTDGADVVEVTSR